MSEIMILNIKYHEDIEEIKLIDKGDWIDLRSAETIEMKQGEYRLISLGISIQLPKGYEAHIVPRSSTFKNFGILQTNHMGVIDESYCGDTDIIMFPALAMRDTKINKNDRICQMRIFEKMPYLKLNKIIYLNTKNRNGLGSTGIK
jgi:dUTP pyrophosphatase